MKWIIEISILLVLLVLFTISCWYNDLLPFVNMFAVLYLIVNIFLNRLKINKLIEETQTNVELIEKHESAIVQLYNNQRELNKMRSKLNEILSKSKKKNKHLDNDDDI